MKRLLVTALVFAMLGLSGCSCADTTEEPVAPVSQDPREFAKCADDNRKYRGISCFSVPLGSSLAKFRELVASQSIVSEEPTKFPNVLRKYSIHPFPGAPMPWNASAHFVLDANCYRLYTIDGFSSESTEEWVRYFSKRFGRPRKDGLAYIWSKAGTKLRVLDGEEPLISFTHDKLIELSSEKMAEAMDRGDYVH